jgi:hypothetical protein
MQNSGEVRYDVRAMKLLRFVLPFLFVRNWHDGSWELSRARVFLVSLTLFIIGIGGIIAYILQAPVVYVSP